MTEKYLVALDVGGTKADAILFRTNGEIIAHVVDPGGIPFDHGLELTLNNCKRTVDKIIACSACEISALYGAIATVEFYYEGFPDFFRKSFNIPKIRLEGDGCSLISAAFGHRDGAGLICGTGSALYMRKGESYCHIGGGGHMIDSCGSGFSLGRYALQAVLRARDDCAEPTLLTELCNEQGNVDMWFDFLTKAYSKGRSYVASFAPNVFIARQRGDLVARKIFNTCAADLANLVWTARDRLGEPFDLVLNGGIFRSHPEYAAAVQALSPADVNFVFSDVPPILGCAIEAMHDIGIVADSAFCEKFMHDYKALKII